MEVSFPNAEQRLATRERPPHAETLAKDLAKLDQRAQELPTLLYHIKPVFQARSSASARASPGST